MRASFRSFVHERARNRCEYCHIPSQYSFLPMQVEHIVARKHGGLTSESNLALACDRCNLHKGTDLIAKDPVNGTLVRLFDPRMMVWTRHFRWRGAPIIGRSAVGRATVALLQMNQERRLRLRQRLIEEGVFP